MVLTAQTKRFTGFGYPRYFSVGFFGVEIKQNCESFH